MLKFLFTLISFLSFLTISAQQVTNIQVTQEGDNVAINYDISSDKTEQTFDIKVECSADGGKTYSINPQSLTGDLTSVSTGIGKRIVWDVLSERETLSGDHFVFQLVATENKPADSFSGNSGTFTDSRDGNVYKWVKIGTQIWMAENLKTSKYRNGDPIVYVTKDKEWRILTTGAYCNYSNDINNANIYGHLYNWHTVNDDRKLAPNGWYIPSLDEWSILINYLGGEKIAGGKLKATGTSFWSSPNIGATNQSGFSALPGGYRGGSGEFVLEGRGGSWWSKEESISEKAWYNYLGCNNSNVFRYYDFKVSGFYVRCVKD